MIIKKLMLQLFQVLLLIDMETDSVMEKVIMINC